MFLETNSSDEDSDQQDFTPGQLYSIVKQNELRKSQGDNSLPFTSSLNTSCEPKQSRKSSTDKDESEF